MLSQGRSGPALALLEAAVTTMRALTAADASDAGWQRDFAEMREGYGRALVADGRLPLAATEADAVQQLAGGLLKSDPKDRRAVRILSLSHALHARVWAAQRQATLADRAWERALAAIEPVARTSDDYAVLEVWVLTLVQLRRPNEALPVLRKLQNMGYRNLAFLEQVRNGGLRLPPADVPQEGRNN